MNAKNTFKHALLPSLIVLALTPTLHAESFWKPDLKENLTNITKIPHKDNFKTFEEGKLWPGIGPNGEAPGTVRLHYSRIPAMTITDDNKLVVMFDLRWHEAYDQNRIDPGVAISEDGGHTWYRDTAWTFNEGKHPRRRAMDPTILHNAVDGSLYVMHGNWATGTSDWSSNWYRNRYDYFHNNEWSTTIYKSTDGGKTWEKNAEFSKTSHPETFLKVRWQGRPTVGFLGGVGSGIVMRDGTLVFPIQTAHDDGNPRTNDGIATTIMYSRDNGKTWEMPDIANALAPNQSSLENMVFEIGNKLVMTGRETRVRGSQADKRWAYYTEDMGQTWHPYPEAEFGSSTAQPTQGSSIYVTLPNGRRVLFVSKPDGNNDGWARGNLSLYMLDAKDPNHVHKVAVIRPGSGNPAGAGYSSLAYKEGNLFIAYEDDGNITVENLTKYMAEAQTKAVEWGLPDEIETEVARINGFTHLNKAQKETLIAKMRRANDDAIAQSFTINHAMDTLKTDSVKRQQQATAFRKALPSLRRQFLEHVAKADAVTATDSEMNLNYLGVQALKDQLNAAFLALNTKLDFMPYVKQVKQLSEYNHDILYRSFDKVFAHYDAGSKYNRLSLGLNTALRDNLQVGVFFEHRNRKQKSSEVGVRAKYQQNAHQLAGFMRYRGVKPLDSLERSHNFDTYVNYAYQIKLSDQFSISPSVGGYLSYSDKSLLDEDVAVKQRAYAGDVGLNLVYQFNGFGIHVRPNVAVIKQAVKLSQSNDDSNVHKAKSHDIIYGVSAGMQKRFASGIALGTDVKLQKYGARHSEANIGATVSYHW